jgi:hypothetical protein
MTVFVHHMSGMWQKKILAPPVLPVKGRHTEILTKVGEHF